ncbi:uncharacterized protein LOC144453313 isoform X2 [Glandiceps talaboti]
MSSGVRFTEIVEVPLNYNVTLILDENGRSITSKDSGFPVGLIRTEECQEFWNSVEENRLVGDVCQVFENITQHFISDVKEQTASDTVKNELLNFLCHTGAVRLKFIDHKETSQIQVKREITDDIDSEDTQQMTPICDGETNNGKPVQWVVTQQLPQEPEIQDEQLEWKMNHLSSEDSEPPTLVAQAGPSQLPLLKDYLTASRQDGQNADNKDEDTPQEMEVYGEDEKTEENTDTPEMKKGKKRKPDACRLELQGRTPSVPVYIVNMARFVAVNETELNSLENARNEKNTSMQTKWGVRVFREWLEYKQYPLDFEDLPTDRLAELLCEFYASTRKQDGKLYGKSSLSGLRASIHRHITGPPYHRKINIMQDREFQVANYVIRGVVKKMKKDGKDTTTHKVPISPSDLKKLSMSPVLSIAHNVGLQRKVWFDLMLHFGRRGREGIRSLTKSSFTVEYDDVGQSYVKYTFNEKVNNHSSEADDNYTCHARMYATNTDCCPVSSFQKYIRLLNPANLALFQRPKSPFNPDETTWYANAPLGESTLGSFMKTISKEAGLSQIYTNHCIRATTCKLLDDAGFDTQHIMFVSGHVNKASVKSYTTQPSTGQQRQLSSTLSGSVYGNPTTSSCNIVGHSPRSTSNVNRANGGHINSSDTQLSPANVPSAVHHQQVQSSVTSHTS